MRMITNNLPKLAAKELGDDEWNWIIAWAYDENASHFYSENQYHPFPVIFTDVGALVLFREVAIEFRDSLEE